MRYRRFAAVYEAMSRRSYFFDIAEGSSSAQAKSLATGRTYAIPEFANLPERPSSTIASSLRVIVSPFFSYARDFKVCASYYWNKRYENQ